MEKQTNIPTLRFSEFKGEWEMEFGNKLFEPISNKTHNSDLPILAISQEFGAVPREMINYQISVSEKSIDGYKVIKKGDFIISLRSFQGGIEYSNYKGICSPAYIILRSKIEISDHFYKIYFKSNNYIQALCSKLEGIRDGKMISYKYFSEIALPFPALPEQTKIAEFFTAIDAKIQALKTKKKLLQQYKKGVMQQLFSQELRFKDENGKEFPKWEMKKLGEIGEFKNGINKSSEDFGFGIPFINLMDVFGKSTISKQNFGLVNANEKEIKQYELKKGDVLFIRSSVKKEGVGETSLILEDLSETVYSGFLIRFRDEKINIDLNFKKYCFANKKFREDLLSLSSTSANTNINQESLNSLEIQLPSLPEQTLIANFLSSLDEKINRTENQIQKTQAWKKGLLQQMFV